MVYQPPVQPQYPGYFTQTLYQPQAPQQSMNPIWVKGLEEAKRYSIAPGSTVPLWDSEDQIIYLKSTDMNGMVSMKIIDYTIREPKENAEIVANNYVTKEDFKSFVDSLNEKLDKISYQKPSVNRKFDKEDK